jgi:molybdopterin-guanine dinucleotide biosynthesis protein A
MGRDKALLEVDGVPMARRVADALSACGAVEVFAVGGDPAALGALGLDVRPDAWPGDGPLPATLTALELAREELVLVVACDLLAPDAETMAEIVGALEGDPTAVAAVPVDPEGHHQWTQAAWRRSARPRLQAGWDAGARSLRRAAADLPRVELTGLAPEALADADTPADLAARRTRSGEAGG